MSPESAMRRRAGASAAQRRPETMVTSMKKLGSVSSEDGSTTASTESSPRLLHEKEQCSPLSCSEPAEFFQQGVDLTVKGGQPMVGEGDKAAGVFARYITDRYITLSSTEFLPKLCCKVPGAILFSWMALSVVSMLLLPRVFAVIAVLFNTVTLGWSCFMVFSCLFGACWMRRDCAKNWQGLLEQHQAADPQNSDVMHFVILPNYKEDEEMVWQTLEQLARSGLAKTSVRIVLAMEAREEGAHAKARRLMERARPLFADVIASFHPAGLPNELAGKSSNTQWAYRELLRVYCTELAVVDPSRVFLTVGDADTLFHPQYLSAISVQALQMSVRERSWSFWQPPVMLLRNLFSCPGPTRVSGYATILFELAGLANQTLSTHFCYSSYTTTLALASHPLVDGWDTDVIAEDHHMFCKSFFAPLWEACDKASSPEKAVVKPQVQLRPVFLPALSYMVDTGESNSIAGWFDSCHARFTQARRHAQGVAELAYVLLQYVRLSAAVGFHNLPFRTHTQIWAIMGKMVTVHIVNQVHGMITLMVSVSLVIEVLRWALSGGLAVLFREVLAQGIYVTMMSQSLGNMGWVFLGAIFGPMPLMGLLMVCVFCQVVGDMQEGRLTEVMPADETTDKDALVPVNPHVEFSALAPAGTKVAPFGFRRRMWLFLVQFIDLLNWAESSLVLVGLIPVVMAAWSLLRRGPSFEYVVAAKPTC